MGEKQEERGRRLGDRLRHTLGKRCAEQAFAGISTVEVMLNLDLRESYFLWLIICSAKPLHSWLFYSV